MTLCILTRSFHVAFLYASGANAPRYSIPDRGNEHCNCWKTYLASYCSDKRGQIGNGCRHRNRSFSRRREICFFAPCICTLGVPASSCFWDGAGSPVGGDTCLCVEPSDTAGRWCGMPSVNSLSMCICYLCKKFRSKQHAPPGKFVIDSLH